MTKDLGWGSDCEKQSTLVGTGHLSRATEGTRRGFLGQDKKPVRIQMQIAQRK
jgi:hypothetical protein